MIPAKRHANVISPKEFLLWCETKRELPPRSVLLTSDDGLRSSLFDMLPVLQESDLECLFFVTGASLSHTATMLWYEANSSLMLLAAPASFSLEPLEPDRERKAQQHRAALLLWWSQAKASQFEINRRRKLLGRIRMHLGFSEQWDAEYRKDPVLRRRFLMLNLAELHQLAESGMCIGAHTFSHPMLSQATRQDAWKEIFESKRNLEDALGQEVWALAYPFGDSSSVTSRELQMAERAGFKSAFLNTSGGIGPETPRFALPRVHLTATMSLAEFEAHISGFHRSMHELVRAASLHAVVGSKV